MDIAGILANSRTIAVVGLSDNPERASYDVASYLHDEGYTIIPVNPNIENWRGINAYKSLSEIREPVDIVDIFRKSDAVLPIVEEAIKIGAKTVWMQLGIVNEAAERRARAAGLNVVMNRCIKIEHRRLKL